MWMWLWMGIAVAIGTLLMCYINDVTGKDYTILMGFATGFVVTIIIYLNQ